MVMAAELSARAGHCCAATTRTRVAALLERAGLPVRGPGARAGALPGADAVDKKAAGGSVRFILLDGIGPRGRCAATWTTRLVRESIAAAAPLGCCGRVTRRKPL